MDVGLAHQRIVVLVPGLVRGRGAVLLALLAADVAPASSVGDVAEFLHVDVEHRPGVVVLVAADGFAGGAVHVGESVEVHVDQDVVDGRWGDAEAACQLHRPFAQAKAKAYAALDDRGAGLVRRGLWS